MSKPRVPPQPEYEPPPRPTSIAGRGQLTAAYYERALAYAALRDELELVSSAPRVAEDQAAYIHATYGKREE